MKKLLFIGLMCFMGAGAFAKSNFKMLKYDETAISIKSNASKQKNENYGFDQNLMFCTVTYTANIYNEFGVYVRSVSETRTVNTGGQYDCVLAYMMAKDEVMKKAIPD